MTPSSHLPPFRNQQTRTTKPHRPPTLPSVTNLTHPLSHLSLSHPQATDPPTLPLPIIIDPRKHTNLGNYPDTRTNSFLPSQRARPLVMERDPQPGPPTALPSNWGPFAPPTLTPEQAWKMVQDDMKRRSLDVEKRERNRLVGRQRYLGYGLRRVGNEVRRVGNEVKRVRKEGSMNTRTPIAGWGAKTSRKIHWKQKGGKCSILTREDGNGSSEVIIID